MVVFARAGRLHLHDIASGRTREIAVNVEREAPELGPNGLEDWQFRAARLFDPGLMPAQRPRIIAEIERLRASE